MNWFYELNGQQMGPVSEAELLELFRGGEIKGSNLVWREGMADWEPLQTMLPPPPPRLTMDPRGMGPTTPRTAEATGGVRHNVDRCVECGQTYSNDELVTLNKSKVCAYCKPRFLQRMAEGVSTFSTEGLWREGNKLVTSSETPMPDRCVRCNSPAHGYRLKCAMSWFPRVYRLAGIFGPIIFAIVWMIVRKKAVLHIGLCEAHRKQRKWAFIALVVGVGMGVACIALGAGTNEWLPLSGMGIIMVGIAWGYLGTRTLYPTRIDSDGNVWARGAGKKFLDELPER